MSTAPSRSCRLVLPSIDEAAVPIDEAAAWPLWLLRRLSRPLLLWLLSRLCVCRSDRCRSGSLRLRARAWRGRASLLRGLGKAKLLCGLEQGPGDLVRAVGLVAQGTFHPVA